MDILGIGNALVDVFCFSDDELALSLGLHPNNTVHIRPERMDELLAFIPDQIPVSGGGASNALKAAAALGASCAFAGCTGSEDREIDRWARLFERDMGAFGIEARLERRSIPTGRCLVLHMPGGMKSVACAPGAAPTLRPEQIETGLVSRAKIVHFDGQLLRNGELTDRVANLCKSFGIPLSIDIASIHIARNHAGTIDSILRQNECVLFMNEDEAHEFTMAMNPIGCEDETLTEYTRGRGRKTCIVRKRGEAGAQAWLDGERYEAAGIVVERPLDDTAAGDCFAGAFLHSWLGGVPLGDNLKAANRFAAKALTVPGSALEPPVRKAGPAL